MASTICEVFTKVYRLEALVIWPKIETANIATIIQKSGPLKIFCERVSGGFVARSLPAGLGDFLNFFSGLLLGVWEDMNLLKSTCAWRAHR